MELGKFVRLVHNRWNISIIAALERSAGAKFVTLANSLGLSRSSLTRCLESLIGQGLVRRNSGYGHPLRPEYLLTDEGKRIGPECMKLIEILDDQGLESFAWRKWTLPLIAAIGRQPARFGA